MKAADIREFFLKDADWVNLQNTVDQFIIGNPDKDVKSVLVTLYSDFEAVRHAVKQGFDMVITHEPTFGIHANEMETINKWDTQTVKRRNVSKKIEFIEDNGLVILRNHDVWDRMPEIGMLPAWSNFLGFDMPPVIIEKRGLQCRFDIEPVKLDDLARSIAVKTASIGEPYAHVFGNGNQLVSKIGLTIGCGGTVYDFMEMGCDVSIVTDDGTTFWSDIKYAKDNGHNVIYVNHGTSEEPGMITMAKYIKDHFPMLRVEHFPHVCGIRMVHA